MKKVSLNELKTKLDGGSAVTLIETLSADEYKRGHLPGAINIPSNQIAELSGSGLPDKSAEIVLYCSGPKCHASENAARELEQVGYSNISVYAEGKEGWLKAGMQLEASNETEPSPLINHD